MRSYSCLMHILTQIWVILDNIVGFLEITTGSILEITMASYDITHPAYADVQRYIFVVFLSGKSTILYEDMYISLCYY